MRDGTGTQRTLAAAAAALTALWLAAWLDWTRGMLHAPRLPAAVPWGLAVAFLLARTLAGWLLAGLSRGRFGAIRRAQRWTAGAGLLMLAGLAYLAAPAWPGPGQLGWWLGLAAPAALAGGYAWWRGLRVAGAPLGHAHLAGVFYSGLAGLASLAAATARWPGLESSALLGYVLLFVALGLASLALASLFRLRAASPAAAAASTRLRRQWLLLAAAIITGVLAAGLAGAQVLAPAAFARLGILAAAGLRTAAMGLGLLTAPVATLLNRLLAPLFPGLRGVLRSAVEIITQLVAIGRGLLAWLLRLLARPLPRLLEEGAIERLVHSPAFRAGSQWGLLLLVLLAAAALFGLALRRRDVTAGTEADLTHESIFSADLVLRQLRALLPRRRHRAPVANPFIDLAGAGDDPRLRIRRAYQAMLEWALAGRLPHRRAAQTPGIYGEALASAVPQAQEAIRTLTGAYIVARYSAEVPSPDEAGRAEGALARLRAAGPPTQ